MNNNEQLKENIKKIFHLILNKIKNIHDSILIQFDQMNNNVNQLLADKSDISHNHDDKYANKQNEHTHDNKTAIDKFSENADGNILYNGELIRVGTSENVGKEIEAILWEGISTKAETLTLADNWDNYSKIIFSGSTSATDPVRFNVDIQKLVSTINPDVSKDICLNWFHTKYTHCHFLKSDKRKLVIDFNEPGLGETVAPALKKIIGIKIIS